MVSFKKEHRSEFGWDTYYAFDTLPEIDWNCDKATSKPSLVSSTFMLQESVSITKIFPFLDKIKA